MATFASKHFGIGDEIAMYSSRQLKCDLDWFVVGKRGDFQLTIVPIILGRARV